MNSEIVLPIIGYMNASYQEKFGIPRQSNLLNSISYIVMCPPYDDVKAFEGITDFSHLWLLWQFHDNKRKNNSKDFQPLIRPPRLGGNQKIGVFASRSMYRPSPIGLSVVQFVELKRINQETRLYVKGADLLNGTPIVDIKPYLAYVDCIVDASSGYAQDAPQRFSVIWSDQALDDKYNLIQSSNVMLHIFDELEQVLALDPTPAYQNDVQRIYGMTFANLNIKFSVAEHNVYIHSIEDSIK